MNFFRFRIAFALRLKGAQMSEDKKSWLKGFLWWAITSPVTIFLFALMIWFAAKAYIFETDVWQSKAALLGVFGLWVLWLIFKNLIKFLLFLAVGVAVFYGFYYYQNKDEIDCEKAGKVWDESEKICEAPKTFMESLEDLWKQYFD